MDSGWAVVLGALVAVVGSAVVPWIREAMTARREETARIDRALEKSIRDVVHVLTRVSYARPASMPDFAKLDVEARDTITAFDLLLDGRANPVSVMLDQAFADAMSKEDGLRLVTRSAVPLLLTGWKAGIYSAPEVYTKYAERRAEAMNGLTSSR